MKTKTQHAPTKRAKQHAKLLKEAMKRPGVKEFMEVYGDWREKDVSANQHRQFAPGKTITFTNHTVV